MVGIKEDKHQIIEKLLDAVKITRAGEDIGGLVYTVRDDGEEFVTVHFIGNGQRDVCVTADSGIALMRDVLRAIW